VLYVFSFSSLRQSFQTFVALALCTNFALNIVETEMQPDKDDELYKKFEMADLGTDDVFHLIF
jgi:hypothetical protein